MLNTTLWERRECVLHRSEGTVKYHQVKWEYELIRGEQSSKTRQVKLMAAGEELAQE